MKRKLLFKLIILALGAFIWMGSSGGRAEAEDSGNTGAPGDSAPCSNSYCHGNTNIIVDVAIAVINSSQEAATEYVAGETYTIKVAVNHVGGNTPSLFGFQLVALTDSDNQSTESFFNPGANVQLATASSTQRLYAEHSDPSDVNTFLVDWTAPASGSGSVTLYAAGNAVNGDGAVTGDGANTTSLTLEEAIVNDVDEVAAKWELNLYPNPVTENINLKGNSGLTGTFVATVVDIAGRAIISQQVKSENGQISIPVANLLSGNYTLMLQNKDEAAVIKFMKL